MPESLLASSEILEERWGKAQRWAWGREVGVQEKHYGPSSNLWPLNPVIRLSAAQF